MEGTLSPLKGSEAAPEGPGRLRSASRHNFVLGVLNGIFFNIASSLISTSLVLPGLIRSLGGGNLLVGILPTIEQGGWLLPQLLVGARLQGWPRKMPLYRSTALLRALFFAGFSLAVALAGRLPPRWVLGAFFAFYTLYNLGAGVAGIPFQEVVAKTVPPERRGTFFGLRLFGGGAVTFLGVSWVVRTVLSEGSRWAFPQNYAFLFGLAFCFALGGLGTFSAIAEPPSTELGEEGSLGMQLRRVPVIYREHRAVRRFLFYKVFSRLAQLADPFYIVYAVEVLGAPSAVIGEYMAVVSGVQLLSYLLWSRLSDRRGNRLLLRWGSGLAMLAPPLSLVLPLLGRALGLPPHGRAYLFAPVFVLSALGNAALNIALGGYILEILPERERPAGLGLVNTATGVVSLLMILGGGLADLVGYPPLFAVAALTSTTAFALSLPLVEPRPVQGNRRYA